jgi:hypothetical protein
MLRGSERPKTSGPSPSDGPKFLRDLDEPRVQVLLDRVVEELKKTAEASTSPSCAQRSSVSQKDVVRGARGDAPTGA